jgi:hypothetical protein
MASMVTSAPRQLESFQQPRNGDDLIGLFVDGLLSEDEALAGRASGDHVQRFAALGARVGSPRGLAVDGDDVGRALAQRLHPAGEAGLEQFGVEPVDHVVERVMGRQAALVGQEALQEIPPLLAPQPDLDEILHAVKRGAQNQKQDFRQRIDKPPALARVRKRGKVLQQAGGRRRFRHRGLRINEAAKESHFRPRRPVNLKRSPCGSTCDRLPTEQFGDTFAT